MDPTALPPPPDPGVPDHPVSLPVVHNSAFLADRLLSVNGLVSLCMLGWSAMALRRPALARGAWQGMHRRLPWLFGKASRR